MKLYLEGLSNLALEDSVCTESLGYLYALTKQQRLEKQAKLKAERLAKKSSKVLSRSINNQASCAAKGGAWINNNCVYGGGGSGVASSIPAETIPAANLTANIIANSPVGQKAVKEIVKEIKNTPQSNKLSDFLAAITSLIATGKQLGVTQENIASLPDDFSTGDPRVGKEQTRQWQIYSGCNKFTDLWLSTMMKFKDMQAPQTSGNSPIIQALQSIAEKNLSTLFITNFLKQTDSTLQGKESSQAAVNLLSGLESIDNLVKTGTFIAETAVTIGKVQGDISKSGSVTSYLENQADTILTNLRRTPLIAESIAVLGTSSDVIKATTIQSAADTASGAQKLCYSFAVYCAKANADKFTSENVGFRIFKDFLDLSPAQRAETSKQYIIKATKEAFQNKKLANNKFHQVMRQRATETAMRKGWVNARTREELVRVAYKNATASYPPKVREYLLEMGKIKTVEQLNKEKEAHKIAKTDRLKAAIAAASKGQYAYEAGMPGAAGAAGAAGADSQAAIQDAFDKLDLLAKSNRNAVNLSMQINAALFDAISSGKITAGDLRAFRGFAVPNAEKSEFGNLTIREIISNVTKNSQDYNYLTSQTGFTITALPGYEYQYQIPADQPNLPQYKFSFDTNPALDNPSQRPGFYTGEQSTFDSGGHENSSGGGFSINQNSALINAQNINAGGSSTPASWMEGLDEVSNLDALGLDSCAESCWLKKQKGKISNDAYQLCISKCPSTSLANSNKCTGKGCYSQDGKFTPFKSNNIISPNMNIREVKSSILENVSTPVKVVAGIGILGLLAYLLLRK